MSAPVVRGAWIAAAALVLALPARAGDAIAPGRADEATGRLASPLARPMFGAPSAASLEASSVEIATPAAAGLATVPADPLADAPMLLARRVKQPKAANARAHAPAVLSAERARTLLRSLTVPGWGQATLGHRKAATVFAVAELSVWTAYTSFRIQQKMRKDSYERTALIVAGIDLNGRDEEFRRIVGSYISSDEYNQLVVYRDAANLFYDTHGVLVDPAGYAAYVAEHSLGPADHWEWPSDELLLRYRGQRKDTQRAALRANAALAMAVVDRLLSAVHAARLGSTTAGHSLQLETLPDEQDPTAFRVGVRTRF